MRKVVYSISICCIFILSGCGAGVYNSAPAFVPMFTKKTEIAGNIFIGPDGIKTNVGIGFLNYFGVYGGGHAVFSLFNFPISDISGGFGSNMYFYGGVLGRHKSELGKNFVFIKELMADYGIGYGKKKGGELTGSNYFSTEDESFYSPLNVQLNLALRWKGLAFGFAFKNVFINYKNYESTFYNYHCCGASPDKLNSFSQYIFEPNIFFRAGGKTTAFFINLRWAIAPFGGSLFTNSYMPDQSIYRLTQISMGLQFNIGLSKE